MGLLDTLSRFLALEPYQAARSEPLPDFDAQIAAIRGRSVNPWRRPGVRDALGVPAIFRAVTLISNTVGSLAFEAWREGVALPQEDAPRIVVRPNPLTTPREFYRETAWSLATVGEAWWWIAARDRDGLAISLYPMPAHEVTVEENPRDLLRPVIRWRDRLMRNDDVRQLVFARESGALRGAGPLQLCGAAVSAAVEAQTWAANFFADGGIPSVIIKSAFEIDENEARNLKAQWVEGPSNVPRVIDPQIEDVKDFGLDPAKAQLTEARHYSNGEAARMFGIPGSLLEYVESGSSLTYQNIAQVYDQFVRACLVPNYIEPIEQAMSDLLTRTTVARANLRGLLRADVKTRAEVYEKLIPLGVMTAEQAQVEEGILPGDVERAPVPFASPQAVPASLPVAGRTGDGIRCAKCRKLLAEAAQPPYRIACPRCKTIAEAQNSAARSEVGDLAAAVTALAARAQPAPVVTVEAPQITVEAPPVPNVSVNFEAPKQEPTAMEYDDAGRVSKIIPIREDVA